MSEINSASETRKIECKDSYKIAVDMYKQEHERWKTWTLFYFGTIAAPFILPKDKSQVPMWLVSFFGILVSILWMNSAVAIRASTHAWREVILDLERGLEAEDNIFKRHEQKLKSFDLKSELRVDSLVKGPPSVTKNLLYLGYVFIIFFILLLVYSLGR